MMIIKFGDVGYNIVKYNKCDDYMWWKKEVKDKLKAIDLENDDDIVLILEEVNLFLWRSLPFWLFAMEEKMQSIIDNKTWKLVKVSKNQVLIDCKWMYKLKYNSTGDKKRFFKGRLVTEDFTRVRGVYYNKVLLPRKKFVIIWLIHIIYSICNLVMN